MAWLRGKLARRLALSYTVLALLVFVTVIAAGFVSNYVQVAMANALNRTNLALLGSHIQTESLNLTQFVQDYVAKDASPDMRALLRVRINERRIRLNDLITHAITLTTPGDLTERTQLADIEARLVNLNLQINRLIQSVDREQGDGEATASTLETLTSEYRLPLEDAIQNFQSYEIGRAQATQDQARQVTTTAIWLLFALAMAAMVFALLTIVRSFRTIILPLADFHRGVELTRQGQMDQPVPVRSPDEIGELAEAFNEMAAQLGQTLAGLEKNLAELRKTRDALHASEELYRSLFNGIPVGLYRTSVDGDIIDINDALAQLLGYPNRESLLNVNAVSFYVDAYDRVRWRAMMQDIGVSQHFETRLHCRDGTVIWVRENSRAAKDENGNILYFEGSLEDITERKLAEDAVRRLNTELERRVDERTAQLMAANKELEAFTYSVSHDLRAPLRALLGYSRLLVQDYSALIDETGKGYLDALQTASWRMNDLIDDMLLLSRVTRTEMRREPVDLSALARAITDELCKSNPSRQADILIQSDLVVNADASLMRIALENLFSNAWKFTSRVPLARIEFGVNENGQELVYFVRDNGAGFDMAYTEKLFTAFQRLHSSAEFDGTGVGLVTVQRVINRHAGRIWAEGAVDQGATFYFTIGV